MSSEFGRLREAFAEDTIEQIVEMVSGELRQAWQELHGYAADIPWILEVIDNHFSANQKAIRPTAKIPVA